MATELVDDVRAFLELYARELTLAVATCIGPWQKP
jgi:hypothetical protein